LDLAKGADLSFGRVVRDLLGARRWDRAKVRATSVPYTPSARPDPVGAD